MSSHQPNGSGGPISDDMVVLRVDDEINEALTGHGGCQYQSPPQPRQQALTLARVLLGYGGEELNGDQRWSCPIAGGRRTVALKPAAKDPSVGGLP
jgi:hypothetical protein